MMTKLATAAAAALLALPAATLMGTDARAQTAVPCEIAVNSVYTNGIGQNQFEYFVQVQNRGNEARQVSVGFGNFPQDVTLFSPQVTLTLRPYQQETVRFGRGTRTNDITLGTVLVTQGIGLSGPFSTRPYIIISNCVAVPGG
ncbi:hypothetical protein ACE7GA_13085 [Roseomonas sp. CCTCC AB2023176]|uniref:hypothetical protein n=1 Tax=Roseomonas sp. CCTCC AB2023176 TaxID=3342640 RepID=UPI0035DDF04F